MNHVKIHRIVQSRVYYTITEDEELPEFSPELCSRCVEMSTRPMTINNVTQVVKQVCGSDYTVYWSDRAIRNVGDY